MSSIIGTGLSSGGAASGANSDITSLSGLTGVVSGPSNIRAGDGTVGAPAYSFSADTDTGIYRSGANTLDFSTNGTQALSINGSQQIAVLGAGVGSATTPSYSFLGDLNTGIFSATADNLEFTTSGVRRLLLGSAGAATFSNVVLGSAGAVGAPSFSFSADSNTGIYNSAADNIDFSCGGVNRVNIGSSGSVTLTPASTDPAGTDQNFYINGNLTVTSANAQTFIGARTNLTAVANANHTGVIRANSATLNLNPASTFTVSTGHAYLAAPSNTGAGTVTTLNGFTASGAGNSGGGTLSTYNNFTVSDSSVGTNVRGVLGGITVGTNKWNLFASASGDNHMLGRCLIGTTNTASGKLAVIGTSDEVIGRLRAFSSQTANILTIDNTTPTTLFAVGPAGSMTAGPTSASTAVHSMYGSMIVTTRTLAATTLTIDTTTTDNVVLVGHTATAAVTITLPAHVNGRRIIIKDSGYNALVNNITLARAGGTGKINNASASYVINVSGTSVTIISDGTDWHLL